MAIHHYLYFSSFSGIVVGQEVPLRRLPQESLVALRDVKRTPPLVLRIQHESATCKTRYSVIRLSIATERRLRICPTVSSSAKDHPMIKSSTYVGPKSVQDPSIVPTKPCVRSNSRSSYRELLERLLHSPENSVLRVKNVDSRHAFEKQARALGYEVVFAQDDDWLYVKIGGTLNQKQPSTQKSGAAQKSVLEALERAPMTAIEVARVLRSDPATCEAILTCLVAAGFVERDDGLGSRAIYRAM